MPRLQNIILPDGELIEYKDLGGDIMDIPTHLLEGLKQNQILDNVKMIKQHIIKQSIIKEPIIKQIMNENEKITEDK